MNLSSKGFTLLEIIISVVLIGIIASVAMVQYSFIIEKSKAKELEQLVYYFAAAVKRYAVEHDGQIPTAPVGGPTSIPFDQLGIAFPANSEVIHGYGYSANSPQRGDFAVSIYRRGSTQLVWKYYLRVRSQNGSLTLSCTNGEERGICSKMGY